MAVPLQCYVLTLVFGCGYAVLATVAETDGTVSREGFEVAIEHLLSRTGATSAPEVAQARTLFTRMFDLFPCEKTGYADFVELSTGLSVLCGGTQDDIMEASFRLYGTGARVQLVFGSGRMRVELCRGAVALSADTNADGYISPEEMMSYLTAVFKVVYSSSSEDVSLSAEQLALMTTEQAFKEADTDGDGRVRSVYCWRALPLFLLSLPKPVDTSATLQISIDEFKAWFHSEEEEEGSDTDGAGGAGADADGDGDGAKPATNMGEARRALNLGSTTMDAVVELFAREVDAGGSIRLQPFVSAMRRFTQQSPVPQDRVIEILTAIFHVLDTDRDGRVPFVELMAGLSVLCAGTRDEKVETVFSLYGA